MACISHWNLDQVHHLYVRLNSAVHFPFLQNVQDKGTLLPESKNPSMLVFVSCPFPLTKIGAVSFCFFIMPTIVKFVKCK